MKPTKTKKPVNPAAVKKELRKQIIEKIDALFDNGGAEGIAITGHGRIEILIQKGGVIYIGEYCTWKPDDLEPVYKVDATGKKRSMR